MITGKHVRRGFEGLAEVHARPIDCEFTDFFGVFTAAHLQNHETSVHGLLFLDVPQQDDRIGQRRCAGRCP